MALDPTTGTMQAVAKPKPAKQPPASSHGEPGRSAVGPAPLPQGPKPKLQHVEPIHPVLEAAGVNTGVQQFNQQVQEVVDAHRKAYGTNPSPGLTLDVVKAQVPPDKLDHLFSVPKSPVVARAQRALTAQGVDTASAPSSPAEALARDLHNVHTRDELNAFMDPSNAAQFADAISDPASKKLVQDAYAQAATRVGAAEKSPHPSIQAKAAMALPISGSFLSKAVGELALAGKQVATGLVLGPVIIAKTEGEGIVKSVEQKSVDPFLHTNKEIGKAIGSGVKRDFTNPGANPGNLLLDLFAIASLGYGTYARVGAAGAALRAGEAGAALRALATKPATGTFHLGDGADVPLSGNPLVAQIQKFVYTRRLKGLSLVENDGEVPTGVTASIVDEKSRQILDGLADPLRQNFSMQNKVGRQLRAADRVERAVRLSLLEPLQRATGAARNTSLVINRIGPRGWRGLTVGEQKLIQVLTTDDPTPLATWRSFHEQMIEEGVGNPAGHRAHLAALEQAAKVIEKPSEKFLDALGAVRSVMDEQTQLRIEKMGLSPESAESRVSRLGTVIRGQSDLAASSDDALRARLAELDNKYNGFVDTLAKAEGRAGDYKATTAVQNAANAKSVARGRGPVYKTIGQQLRDQAEAKLAKVVAAHADDPVVQSFLRQMGEADSIRAELSGRADKAIGLDEGVATAASVPRNPGARYLLYQSLAKVRRRPSTFFRPQAGPFGVAAPGSLPELSHYFTGDVIRAGDFRIDATRLATESYARTVALAMKLDTWKRLHDHYATEHPTTPHDVPIRDERAVSEELRRIINKADSGQVLTAEDVHGLPSQMIEALTRYLLPHPDDVAEGAAHWKWLDPRYLASEPRSALPTPLVRAFSALNEPLRDLTLFVRPGYILNALNNAQMLAIDQGFFAIPNFVRALKAHEFYGPEATRMLDAMAGEGRMLSYAPNVGGVTRFSHALARSWNKVTDLYFRRAASIFYLRKLGYHTSEQITQVLTDSLHDDAAKKVVTEASQRAKKAMVELDNLTPFEKNVLRHVIFVYPWVSRSAVWSLRTIVEHPAQAAIYSEIGQEYQQELDPVLKHLPAWMRDTGYVPVGWNKDGSPRVINPGSINTFSTLGQIAGLAEGDQTFTDLLGPGADLVVRLAEERDRFGRKYAHPYVDPFLQTLGSLPQLATLKRANQKEPVEKPLDITNSGALVQQGNADVHRPIFFPGGFWNTYGPLILSGMDPRSVDPRAVEARWWQGQPWEARQKHELALVQKWTSAQGKFIGKSVPAPVREGNQLASEFTSAYHSFAQTQGRSPTMLERTAIEIDTLQGLGRISDGEAAKLHANLKQIAPDELPTFRTGVLDKFANGKDLADWHRQVALVARITNRQNLDDDVQTLVHNKIVPSGFKDSANATGGVLQKYGRAYLAYDAKVREFAAKAKKLRAEGKATGALDAQLRVWQDQQDQPVVIDGHRLPPLPRLAIARLTPEQLNAHLKGNLTANWSNLSALDKQLAGRQTSAAVTEGWGQLHAAEAAYHKTYPGQRLSPEQELKAAKEYDQKVGLKGAFVQDVQFSELPNYERFKQLHGYTGSANKTWWDWLFNAAATMHKYAASPDYAHGAKLQAYWNDVLDTQVLPAIKAEPSFYREVQSYLQNDRTFLQSLYK